MALSIGRMLKNVRAGEAHLLCRQEEIVSVRPSVVLGSSAFVDGGSIPAEYAGHGVGTNESPPLHWSGVPDRTAELVLVVEDPDAPLPRPFVHLIATGIAPQIRSLRATRYPLTLRQHAASRSDATRLAVANMRARVRCPITGRIVTCSPFLHSRAACQLATHTTSAVC